MNGVACCNLNPLDENLRISVDQIMAHPYMAAPSLGGSIFRPHPREILRQVSHVCLVFVYRYVWSPRATFRQACASTSVFAIWKEGGMSPYCVCVSGLVDLLIVWVEKCCLRDTVLFLFPLIWPGGAAPPCSFDSHPCNCPPIAPESDPRSRWWPLVAPFPFPLVGEKNKKVMQERYNASMASKRLCTVASSSRGTADSAGAEGSGSPSAASAASSATAGGVAMPYDTVPRPYERGVERSPGDDGFEAPCMTEEEAARVTGGFMAVGGVRNMVKALEKALSGMGAEVCLLL